MLGFIGTHLPELISTAVLVSMFGWVVYLNVSYSREKQREQTRLSDSLKQSTSK